VVGGSGSITKLAWQDNHRIAGLATIEMAGTDFYKVTNNIAADWEGAGSSSPSPGVSFVSPVTKIFLLPPLYYPTPH